MKKFESLDKRENHELELSILDNWKKMDILKKNNRK